MSAILICIFANYENILRPVCHSRNVDDERTEGIKNEINNTPTLQATDKKSNSWMGKTHNFRFDVSETYGFGREFGCWAFFRGGFSPSGRFFTARGIPSFPFSSVTSVITHPHRVISSVSAELRRFIARRLHGPNPLRLRRTSRLRIHLRRAEIDK